MSLMQRNKYSKEFIEWLRVYAPNHSMADLVKKTGIEKHKLEQVLWRNKIQHKDYDHKKVRSTNESPIGTEYVKPDGMVLIKVDKNRWEYKQRYIYEQYHKVNLPTEIMVIFLDGDKTNFSIENLRAVSTPVYNTARNKHLISNFAAVTDAGLDVAELYQEVVRGGDDRQCI